MPLLTHLSSNLSTSLALVVPGIGLMCKSYVIFSVGIMKLILEKDNPQCFLHGYGYPACTEYTVNALTNTIPLALLLGTLLFTVISRFVRLSALGFVTITLMFYGACLLVNTPDGVIEEKIMFVVSALWIFALAVGGEVPVSASIAAANKTTANSQFDVAAAYSMHVVGLFLNVLITSALLKTSIPHSTVWRVAYLPAVLTLSVLVVHRFLKLLASAPKPNVIMTQASFHESMAPLKRAHFGTIYGPCLCWFFWDFIFYGKMLMQDKFIVAIADYGDDLEAKMDIALYNATFTLAGTFLGVFLVKTGWSLQKLQLYAFLIMGFLYPSLLFLANMKRLLQVSQLCG
jgi:hypothetical protein